MNQNLFNALDNMGYILLESELEAVVVAVLKDHPKYERAVEIVRDIAGNHDGNEAIFMAEQFVKDYPE